LRLRFDFDLLDDPVLLFPDDVLDFNTASVPTVSATAWSALLGGGSDDFLACSASFSLIVRRRV
jgi:hypothetical protein